MKAKVLSHCLPKRKTDEFECVEVVIHVDLPFVPVAGTMLKLTPDGEFLRVDQVFWSVTDPDVIDVFIEEPEVLPTFAFMRKEGWREDVFAAEPTGAGKHAASEQSAGAPAPKRGVS